MFIFCADLFQEQYIGGAELTLGALMATAPVPTHRINSGVVTQLTLEQNKDKFWVFGNHAQMSRDCLVYAAKHLNYAVVEFDYKWCKYRSEHLHEKIEGKCDCADTTFGKLSALFLAKAKKVFWMSKGQMDNWQEKFEPLKAGNHVVLSSVFSDESLDYLEELHGTEKDNKYVVLGSDSWIKGKDAGIEYAEQNNLEYDVVWGLGYRQFLEKLAASKGLIHLPPGFDTCPRMVIEAQLLGCEVITNSNTQHIIEDWWRLDREEMLEFLRQRTDVFWQEIAAVEENHLPAPPVEALEEKHFSIIIPTWDSQRWTEPVLRSVLGQKYENYTVYFTDDASEDDTLRVAQEVVAEYPEEIQNKVHITKNEARKFALHNICKMIEETRDDTIIVLVDGDDLLSSPHVLSRLNQLYSEDNVWLSTGSYVEFPSGRVVKSMAVPEDVWETGIRKFQEPPGHPNIFSHLRTFRKDLYSKINHDDLKGEDGEYYSCTFDRALMYPMIEMAGPDHHCVVSDVTYVYNCQNPRSVHLTQRRKQLDIEREIREKEPYTRVEL